MAQIQLSDAMARLALDQSQSAGFGDDVSQYVAQLIWINYLAGVRRDKNQRNRKESTELPKERTRDPVCYFEQLEALRTEIPSPRNDEELAEMLQEGIDSGICPIPWDESMTLIMAGIRAQVQREGL